MNWINPTPEDILKQAELEDKFPIAAGVLLAKPARNGVQIRVTMQREHLVSAVRRSGKRAVRTRIKQTVA